MSVICRFRAQHVVRLLDRDTDFLEIAENGVQDTSCRGSGGVPQL